MDKIQTAIKMAKVVVTNLLTWLMLAQTILTAAVASGQLDQYPDVLRYAVLALGVVGGAVAFIRRVTPVSKDERGLLPKP